MRLIRPAGAKACTPRRRSWTRPLHTASCFSRSWTACSPVAWCSTPSAPRAQDCRTLRLDVLGGNVPAERLYTGQGFARRGTVRMFYADTGWTDYGLYEYLL